jgi:hypothetical protein
VRKEKSTAWINRYKMTLAMGVFSILYMLLYSFINIDLFELLVVALAKIEALKAEEVFLGTVFIVIGFLIDLLLFWRRNIFKRKMNEEKLSTLRSTMTTVQDVVNNFLNNLLFFRFEAEKSAALNEESLKVFDDLVSDTANKLQEIDALEKILKRDFGAGITGIVISPKAE